MTSLRIVSPLFLVVVFAMSCGDDSGGELPDFPNIVFDYGMAGDNGASREDIPFVINDNGTSRDVKDDAPILTDLVATDSDEIIDDSGAGDPGGNLDQGLSKDSGCVPYCKDRECGNDNCGGSCGSCPNGWWCSAFVCVDPNVCVPDCAGKNCGDDGCGGTCGSCADGIECSPEGTCMIEGECNASAIVSLTCEAPSGGLNTGMPPNSDALHKYPAVCGSHYAPGPEKAHRFRPDQSGNVTFSAEYTPLDQSKISKLNIFLLEGQVGKCSVSQNCVAWGHDNFVYNVQAGSTYYLIVDTDENITSSYSVTIDCSWYTSTDE